MVPRRMPTSTIKVYKPMFFKVIHNLLTLTSVIILLQSCGQPHVAPTLSSHITQINLQKTEIPTNGFTLTAATRISDTSQPLHIYIEGDGRAYINRGHPSPNPTPFNPVALQLAAQNTSANVAYLSRPCQYSGFTSPACSNNRWWTINRYNQPIVDSLNEAIDTLKLSPTQPIYIYGYSGGGTLAAVLAATRPDVMHLTTFAGNLDVDAFNKHHGVTPMQKAVKPTDYINRLRTIPQTHYVGKKDRVVPAKLTRAFVQKLNTSCAEVIEVDTTHGKGWENINTGVKGFEPSTPGFGDQCSTN
jgi:dienelactone hydrolase